MILGIFLAIALFFNSAQLSFFEKSIDSDNAFISVNTTCQKQSLDILCTGNYSLNDALSNETHSANKSLHLYCDNQFHELNCSSVFDKKESNTIAPSGFSGILQLFALLCLIPFLITSIVILLDAFRYIGRIPAHAKIIGFQSVKETLKDATILLFIVPFTFITFYFGFFLIIGFTASNDYVSIGFTIFKTIVFCAYLMIVLLIVIKTWEKAEAAPQLIPCIVVAYGIMATIFLLLGVIFIPNLEITVLGLLLLGVAIGAIFKILDQFNKNRKIEKCE